jgi:hypothetical protein
MGTLWAVGVWELGVWADGVWGDLSPAADFDDGLYFIQPMGGGVYFIKKM